MRIMLYSQHVLGIGHFFRSMEVARALDRHEILFVEGGDPLPGYAPPAHVKRFILPSIMMDADFKALEIQGGSLEETKLTRRRMLMEAFRDFAPHVLLTELFPFGRKQFRFELEPLLERIQQEKRSTKLVCSLRDILVEKKDQAAYEQGVLALLNRYYDLLLVHSDPHLIPLEESFERIHEIRIPLRYTGFVVRDSEPQRRESGAEKVIVASSGGGKVGRDLLASTIQAVRKLSSVPLQLRVFTGPFMEKADRELLSALAAEDSRVRLLPFSLDFLQELAEADLSISMAGYNTCMDILSTGIRALVHPFPQNREQALRAGKLEGLGRLKILPSLDASTLSRCIAEELDGKGTADPAGIDLQGKANTARWIEAFFEKGNVHPVSLEKLQRNH